MRSSDAHQVSLLVPMHDITCVHAAGLLQPFLFLQWPFKDLFLFSFVELDENYLPQSHFWIDV